MRYLGGESLTADYLAYSVLNDSQASVSMIVACLTVLLGYASRLAKKYLPDSVTRTVWPTTNPSGFELATPNRGQAINVDITTTVWAEDQTVMYGKARPDEEQGKRFDDDLHGDQKTSDQALSRCALSPFADNAGTHIRPQILNAADLQLHNESSCTYTGFILYGLLLRSDCSGEYRAGFEGTYLQCPRNEKRNEDVE